MTEIEPEGFINSLISQLFLHGAYTSYVIYYYL